MAADPLANYRNEYKKDMLDISSMHPDPVVQFGIWMEDAIRQGIEEPTAMTLATVGADGKPSARMVLLKGFDKEGFVFFTNYDSRKGFEIEGNPDVALVFYWKELERQVRIEGRATKTTGAESDEYFKTRPVESQAGAIVSPQSQVIPNRKELESKLEELLSGNKELTRPKHWGGYHVFPEMIEFWQGRPGRLHDRIRYLRHGNQWKIERLAP
jgi:pyridoxamine 5'-phosphate oxidase